MAKGSSFERDICKTFSRWWTKGEREDVFWRTAGSGARATVRTKQGKTTSNSYGDMMALDPIGQPFIGKVVVEMKRGYNKASLQDFIDRGAKSKPLPYEEFVAKLNKECDDSGRKYWMLVVQRDRRKKLAIISRELADHVNRNRILSNIARVKIIKAGYACMAMDLDSFLLFVDPEFFMEKK